MLITLPEIPDFLDTPQSRRIAIGSAAALGLAIVISAAIVWWPVRTPDVATDRVDSIASFVMSPDFNSLSTEERLKYMTAFANRYHNLDDDDAVALAEFIADMNYDKRKQIEENMKGLVFDFLAESALSYENIPADQREQFLEQMLLDMDRMGDDMNNANRNLSDTERLTAMRRHGQKEKDRASEQISGQVDARGANMLFNVYNSEVSGSVPATQRGAIARLMLDLTKVRRGDPLNRRPRR
jgi:hypothetical protein